MVRKLLDLLTPPERKQALVLLAMILLMALLDMAGIASIVPFMAVLANPGVVEGQPQLQWLAQTLGIEDRDRFLLVLGFAAFAIFIFSLVFKTLTVYVQNRFVLMREYSLGRRLMEGYLRQPYPWFLNRHSADLARSILGEVGMVVTGGLLPLMNLVAQSLVALALLTLLVLVDPQLALTVGVVLGMAYAVIFRRMSRVLHRLGEERVNANHRRFLAVSEAFGAVKEVKLAGLEPAYARRFARPAEIYARNQASANAIVEVPRYLLEAMAFGGLLLIMLYLIARDGSFAAAVPTVVLYAFAGYRLLPALQQLYAAVSQLRFSSTAVDRLHAEFMGLEGQGSPPVRPLDGAPGTPPLTLREGIELSEVTVRYPGAPRPALDGVSLRIPALSKVGFVGPTGSGKTTTMDLILGLLTPESGTLLVDGEPITRDNVRRWQRILGYVPQQIYLADDTVAANIALGAEPAARDLEAIVRAATMANLHAFVTEELAQGYDTLVGERGVRLSGGQRQRIGIARALYHRPQVLIFDEATSALDNLTEQAVMEAVANLGGEVTVLLVAHRLSTVEGCDQIYLLEGGQIRASGTFESLMEESELFRAMTRTASESDADQVDPADTALAAAPVPAP